jgi:hypothetical protein
MKQGKSFQLTIASAGVSTEKEWTAVTAPTRSTDKSSVLPVAVSVRSMLTRLGLAPKKKLKKL